MQKDRENPCTCPLAVEALYLDSTMNSPPSDPRLDATIDTDSDAGPRPYSPPASLPCPPALSHDTPSVVSEKTALEDATQMLQSARLVSVSQRAQRYGEKLSFPTYKI